MESMRKMRRNINYTILLMLGSILLSGGVPSVWAVPADGGYEANVLPADAGWVEKGTGFLGDCVTVANGVMTYDGTLKPASGASGMTPARIPPLVNAGTVEYRVRCRAIGGNPKQWYQFFISANFGGEKTYYIYDQLGHHHDYKDQQINTTFYKPEQNASMRPPTSNGRWDANEWVTIRHIVKDAGEGKYHLESWITGPGGEKKFIEATKEHSGYPAIFWIGVRSQTCKEAIFDLDYIRWSGRAVPHGTPLEAAIRAPSVGSIHPRAGSPYGGTTVIVKGGGFNAKTAVAFGRTRARAVRYIDEYTLRCAVPGHKGTGWVDVLVRNSGGKAVVKEGFFYGRLPRVRKIKPEKGSNLGDQRVRIQGSGFQKGTNVKFGQQEAGNIQVVNSNRIVCTTPAPLGRWSGPSDLTVTNPDGGYTTAQAVYTYERSSPVSPKILGWAIEVHSFNLPVAIQKLEQMPFHGAVFLPIQYRRLGAGTFTQEMADENTAILKAVEFQRFEHNFLRALLTGKRVEPWLAINFFEDWTEVLSSYRRYARLAKETGFEGIWLDVENYGGKDAPQLSYSGYRDTGKSFEECERQVKLRAREMMAAMLSEFPEIKVMTSFGLGVGTGGLDLLPAFVDGLLEAVASDEAYARAQVIDGYEEGYHISTPVDYQRAYDRMRRPGGIAYQRSQQDEAWADYGAAAFGLSPSEHDLDFARAQFISAMNRTDEYVWLWIYGNFFANNNFPGFLGSYAKNTDAYIRALAEFTGLPRTTPADRYRTLGHWRMEEGQGTVTADLSGLGFDGRLSEAGIWTEETPRLLGVSENTFALDFRDNRHDVLIDGLGYYRAPGYSWYMGSSHLGNLYFTDHTIEFSFWWDGSIAQDAQYLYGADGGEGEEGKAHSFGYGGFIPAVTRKLVHWQRGNYGGEFGGVEIDLERAQAARAYRFGQWADVAIKVKGINSRDWKIFLNGRDVTNNKWAGVYKGHESVGGFATPRDGKWRAHFFRLDLVLGARNADELGIIEHFNGMLDEFRITAGQVPARQLLSLR